MTFALCWAPFLYSVESAKQVLDRLFPFARGIFEVRINWLVVSSVIVELKFLVEFKLILFPINFTNTCTSNYKGQKG